MRIIVTGSRNWTDWRAVFDALGEAWAPRAPIPITVIQGGCPTGADLHARMWVYANPWVVEETFSADWAAYGRRAGPIRNAEMIKAGADLVLAFPLGESRGTRHTIRLAREAGIPVKVWDEEE